MTTMNSDYSNVRKLKEPEHIACHYGRFNCPKCQSIKTGTDYPYTRFRWMAFKCNDCKYVFKKSSREIGALTDYLTPDTIIEIKMTIGEWAQLFNPVLRPEESMQIQDTQDKQKKMGIPHHKPNHRKYFPGLPEQKYYH